MGGEGFGDDFAFKPRWKDGKIEADCEMQTKRGRKVCHLAGLVEEGTCAA